MNLTAQSDQTFVTTQTYRRICNTDKGMEPFKYSSTRLTQAPLTMTGWANKPPCILADEHVNDHILICSADPFGHLSIKAHYKNHQKPRNSFSTIGLALYDGKSTVLAVLLNDANDYPDWVW